MKKMKKFLAMLLAMAMVMGMSATVLAASTDPLDTALADDTKVDTAHGYPSADDKATVTISNIVGEPEITLYRIAEPVYKEHGLEKFTFVTGAEALNNNQGPTADQIMAVANGIKSGDITAESVTPENLTYDNATYTGQLGAGAYIAIIASPKGSPEQYNPIYLTVTYNNAGQVVGGNVSVNEKYLWGTTAVAKHTTPDVDKEIDKTTTTTDSSIKADGTDVNAEGGETASLGDVISYTVKPNPMPSYPQNAANQTLFISDTMNTGLTFDYSSLKVKLQYPNKDFLTTATPEGETKVLELVPAADGTITLPANSFAGQTEALVIGTAAPTVKKAVQTTPEGADGFNINFNYVSLIYDNAGNVFTPVITYNATLNESAAVGKPGLENKVNLYFASDSSSGSTHTTTDTPEEGDNIKVKEDEEIVYTYRLAVKKVDDTPAPNAKPLEGAVFGVYTDEACTDLVSTMTTNADGYAISTQIGTTETGKYWVKELEAPTGYQLNPEPFEVEVTWTSATSTATVTTQTIGWTTDVNESEDPSNPVQIGWAVNGELKDMDEYADADAAEAAGAKAAYKKYGTAASSTVTSIETNQGEGSGVVLYGKDIVNTKLVALPSTGGIGTTIFTIGGCAIMILAAGLYFMSRRKSVK